MNRQHHSVVSNRGVNLDSHFILNADEYHSGPATSSNWSLPIAHLQASYRGWTIHSHYVTGSGSRHVVPPPPWLLVYHYQEYTRNPNLHPRGFLQVDDAAFHAGHHNNVHMENEHMSYEDLLALGERVGNVSRGLSDEMIRAQLKTRDYKSPQALEQQETDCCVICQDEYREQETIGVLRCGHEYHANCLRKWLLMKSVCPLCKSEALTIT